MKHLSLFSKIKFTGLAGVAFISFGVSASGWMQMETGTDAWLSLARLLGGGVIGIIMLIAITRLVQALKNQPLDGQKVTSELLSVIQKLDVAITVMNTSTRADHDRLLRHDDDFLRRLEVISSNEALVLANQNRIVENQGRIIKQSDDNEQVITRQLDRIEQKQLTTQ